MRFGRALPLRSVTLAAAMLVFFTLFRTTVAQENPMGQQESVEYRNAQPGVKYLGDKACLPCHLSQYESFKKTDMGRSMSLPSIADELGEFKKPVKFKNDKLRRSYSVYTREGKFFHQVDYLDSEGRPFSSETYEVLYSVGSGDHGRSYIVGRGDYLFMSPISYYTAKGGWDLTPGYEARLYRGFTRPIGDLCVYCHSGLSQPVEGTQNLYRQPAFPILTISCERCHGPAEIHVRERLAGAPLSGPVDTSIVNPAKLQGELRTEVCKQCHLSGDARILKPDKTYADFRPGTPINDAVSILSVPPELKTGTFLAIGHVEQMELSRCWSSTQGKMTCFTCHDPHVQPKGADAVEYFRNRCLTCHTLESCKASSAARQATSDNCMTCHMPKRAISTIAHTALTDHRIPRFPGEPSVSEPAKQAVAGKFLWLTRPEGAAGAAPDLRTMALAYYQVAESYPGYAQTGLALLERAAKEYPDDAEVHSALGLVYYVMGTSPMLTARSKAELERAIALGSTSSKVRVHLARIRLEQGQLEEGIKLLDDAMDHEPYDAPAYLELAHVQAALGNKPKAIELLNKVLDFDPGNKAAREQLGELTGKH
jgi:Tetratricopeptide repeat